MSLHPLTDPFTLEVGTLPRPDLLDALHREGVQLNESAQTLLDDAVFDLPAPQSVTVVERSLTVLGFGAGAPLRRIYDRAQDRGLYLCPASTGPYLRLAWLSQPNAPDAIMSNGRAPTGSLTVAAPVLRPHEDFPRGFYLRVIDGCPWLRGYHCDLTHTWNPDDRFVFAVSPPPAPPQS